MSSRSHACGNARRHGQPQRDAQTDDIRLRGWGCGGDRCVGLHGNPSSTARRGMGFARTRPGVFVWGCGAGVSVAAAVAVGAAVVEGGGGSSGGCMGQGRVLIVSFRFVSFRFVSFRFVSFRFVSFRFVSFRFVSFRFVSFRFVIMHDNKRTTMPGGGSFVCGAMGIRGHIRRPCT
jgi:hypothetical protein